MGAKSKQDVITPALEIGDGKLTARIDTRRRTWEYFRPVQAAGQVDRQRLHDTRADGVDAQLGSIDEADQPADDSWRALTTRNATRLLRRDR